MTKKRYDPVPLIRAAITASAGAKALYSRFQVGAALLCADGSVVTGFNIESSSYGLTICAERVAMFRALSEGKESFTAIAIVAGSRNWCPPCGACRQIIWEFCGDISVILANLKGDRVVYSMAELLPRPFDGGFLG